MVSLFDPIQTGDIKCQNRIFFAPVTRTRASRDFVPTDIMPLYYEQRSSTGLIISEATGISQEGMGTCYAPGIWSDEQVEAWKPITKAVHDKGGRVVCQLWHMGRLVHSSVTGHQPVSASATKSVLPVRVWNGKAEPETAREMTHDDIKRTVNDYAQAAKNAIRAGFDGVQIHAANGYLIDQFLRDNCNFRTDEYGGSVENRIRFMQEVVDAIVDAIGADKTSIRLSPNGDCQGTIDSNPEPLFVAAAKYLQSKNLAFLELRENTDKEIFGGVIHQPQLHSQIRKVFTNPLVLNQNYTREEAIEAVANGTCDAISFGRDLITNPDLAIKFKENKPLRRVENALATYYTHDAEGYTTYPFGSD